MTNAELEYLRGKWRHDASDPGTGIDNESLISELKCLYAKWKDTDEWCVVKARLFARACDRIAVGASGLDWFPAFGCWKKGRRPVAVAAVNSRNDEIDRLYHGDAVGKIRSGWETGRYSMWKDFDHSAPDWDAIYSLGWPGLEARLAKYERDTPFYRAERIALEAAKRFLRRLGDHAEAKAAAEPDGSVGRTRLAAQAAALRSILVAPPKTAYEVLVFHLTYFVLSENLDNLQVRSSGNIDRLLAPYYRADIAAGRTTEALFREHLVHFWWQWGSMDNYWGQPIWLGGTKADGTTEFNEVTRMVLDVHDELNNPTPKLIVKIAESTPQEWLDRLFALIRNGRPLVLCCEESMRKVLKGWRGCTDEECSAIEMNGCYEFYVRGRQNVTQSSHVSFLEPVAEILRRAAEGRLSAATFDKFRAEYEAELKRNVLECAELTDLWERHLGDINPGAIYSLTLESALAAGKDAYFNGQKYNDTAMLSVGLGTAVDALLAVKELVYERGEMTLAELGRLMAANWKGREDLRLRMCRSKRKWGTNDAEANALGRAVLKVASAAVNGRPNSRGGIWGFSSHPARQFIELARHTGATPDGRLAGEECSKNVSPTMGVDTEGMTAVVGTVSHLDALDMPINFTLDLMLHPSAVEGEKGLAVMTALMRQYFASGGLSLNVNVFSVEQLRDAQTHPERYANLQVRVCGWNVRWNDMCRAEQDQYIRRAEAITP